MLTTSRWKEGLLAASGRHAGESETEAERFQYLAMRVEQSAGYPNRMRDLVLNYLCHISATDRPAVLDRLAKEVPQPSVLAVVEEIRQRIA